MEVLLCLCSFNLIGGDLLGTSVWVSKWPYQRRLHSWTNCGHAVQYVGASILTRWLAFMLACVSGSPSIYSLAASTPVLSDLHFLWSVIHNIYICIIPHQSSLFLFISIMIINSRYCCHTWLAELLIVIFPHPCWRRWHRHRQLQWWFSVTYIHSIKDKLQLIVKLFLSNHIAW